MSFNLFECCDRADESKYIHPCACPAAAVICASEQIDAEILGFGEYVVSAPPKKFKKQTMSGTLEGPAGCCAASSRKQIFSGNRYWDQGGSPFSPPVSTVKRELFVNGGSIGFDDDYENNNTRDYRDINSNSDCGAREPLSDSVKYYPDIIVNSICDCACVIGSHTSTLGEEDTDAAALARETPAAGTSCSSTWQVRSTGFIWTERTSAYEIECTLLIVGLEYEVLPQIRKRTVVIGSFGAWEDVVVAPTTFTATSDTETIDDAGNPIDLDFIQGYEYEITGAIIEKKA